jgi:hypothetical protein
MQSLETVARALNDNNPCRAAIALVHAKFPPLPDSFAERRMIEVDKLSKDSLAYARAHAGHLSLGQLKVMSAIRTCRTAAPVSRSLGHVERRDDRGHVEIAYNSRLMGKSSNGELAAA